MGTACWSLQDLQVGCHFLAVPARGPPMAAVSTFLYVQHGCFDVAVPACIACLMLQPIMQRVHSHKLSWPAGGFRTVLQPTDVVPSWQWKYSMGPRSVIQLELQEAFSANKPIPLGNVDVDFNVDYII